MQPTIQHHTAIEKVKLWQKINANKKEIKRLEMENQILETKLKELEKSPYDYFSAKERMKKQVEQAQMWAEGLTRNWRQKYNLDNLQSEFEKITI